MASHKDTVIAKWTDQLTQLFVSVMVDEVKKGNRTTTTFNKAGWNNIQREFNNRTGRKYTLAQFKNKTFKVKDEYGSFKKVLSQLGFGWDNVNKKVVVEDDTVWGYHIKANPKWAKFRNEGLPLYP
ncbi:uncharacterized protein LOC115753942 [Rhodamnia argentea]|uniref:Uncharacterized protein LOC115753942 n=1 Tax=Rhodamnia argentea TaxID=178133 RepID=A0A8B8QNA9_9MYRT|nr:uncharacterized protein LOC115753942 [Rhodamnia argentea]